MEIRSARHDLAKSLIAAPDVGDTARFRAVREILIEHGAANISGRLSLQFHAGFMASAPPTRIEADRAMSGIPSPERPAAADRL
jgi:hypothetical protein